MIKCNCDASDMVVLESGAKRKSDPNKGRCDLLPLDMVIKLIPEAGPELTCIYTFLQTGLYTDLLEAITCFGTTTGQDMYTLILDLSIHFKEGAIIHGERNWEKGIPISSYIDSGVRHLIKYYRGDEDESHDRAFVWNIICAAWTCCHMPSLMDSLNLNLNIGLTKKGE